MKQTFLADKSGIIQSGEVTYTLDEKTGKGDADYTVTAGVWAFTKTWAGQGAFKVDPENLKSANIKKDMVIQAGDVRLLVADIVGDRAVVDIKLENGGTVHVNGTAFLSLKEEFISIINARAIGTVFGYNVSLNLKPKA